MNGPAQLARVLAGRARVIEALARAELEREGPLRGCHEHVNGSLGPVSAAGFADAYAQSVTYGMLAARWWSAGSTLAFTRANLVGLLPSTSLELRELFGRLVNSNFGEALARELDALAGLLANVEITALFAGRRDPSIHFYEEFLDAYDPQLRRERGVYYTPDEVVACVVRTVDAELREGFGLALGLADTASWASVASAHARPEGIAASEPFVQILDPASGTGTFLLGVIELVHATMSAEYARAGLDVEAARAAWIAYVRQDLLPRLHGFELTLAPWVVSHLRLGLALQQTGFVFGPGDRLRVDLANTLVQTSGPAISVVLGNPPYERESSANAKGENAAPIDDFDDRTRARGAGGSIQATRNSYYYFWRWALWRALDQRKTPGIVSLVTASSFLRGPGFVGMREHVRANYDRAYVLDLEGDQLGPRITENVFAIKIPVCVTTVIRRPIRGRGGIYYQRVSGTREHKLEYCAGLDSLARVPWRAVTGDPWIAGGSSDYAAWPRMIDLFPLRFTGYHFYRTWPIAPDVETLRRRWAALMEAAPSDRARLFKPTRDRTIDGSYAGLPTIASLAADAACPAPVRTSFRAFDRQWCLLDPRLGDFLRPALWQGWSPNQVYLTSMLSGVLGPGPGAVAAGHVSDCHHFRGSYGGKDVIPLWRDSDAREPNLCTGLADILGAAPEDVFAYAYAVLANPSYVARFADELQVPGPRLPVTKDPSLFERGAALGRELLRWHTYAAPFELSGSATIQTPIPTRYPETHAYAPEQASLRVGEGCIVGVAPELMRFSISGRAVVKSWLDYRMKRGAGRRSSPLDDVRLERWTDAMTRELLELLWVLEATIARYPLLDAWLEQVLAGELFTAAELPTPGDTERKPPKPG